MPTTPALRRLLHIRELEEEQRRVALETALGHLSQLREALSTSALRRRTGSKLIRSSVQSGEMSDRIAGIEEVRVAENHASVLSRQLAKAEAEMARLRERFLAIRVQRLQAKSLIEQSDARAATEEARRLQQDLDDLYRSRLERGN